MRKASGLTVTYCALYPSFSSIMCVQCGLHVKEKGGLSDDILRGPGH